MYLALIGPVVSDEKSSEVFSIRVHVKQVTPRASHFCPQGYNSINLDRGSQDRATYQISNAWAL